MTGGFQRRVAEWIESAEHPSRVKAVLVLWVLFLVGTLAFVGLDLALRDVQLAYWQSAIALASIVVGTATVLRTEY